MTAAIDQPGARPARLRRAAAAGRAAAAAAAGPRSRPARWPPTGPPPAADASSVLAALTAATVRRWPAPGAKQPPARRCSCCWTGWPTSPAQTWQERWLASGADAAGAAWRQACRPWLRAAGRRLHVPAGALSVGRCRCGLRRRGPPRPCTGWSAARISGGRWRATWPPPATRTGSRGCAPRAGPPALSAAGSPGARCAAPRSSWPPRAAARRHHRRGRAGVAGRRSRAAGSARAQRRVFYRLLHEMGIFGARAPADAAGAAHRRAAHARGLIDRYRLACRPVRDLLVDYLRERQPALDYTSLDSPGQPPGQPVLGRHRAPPSRHRHPAPARRRSPPPGNSACGPRPRRSPAATADVEPSRVERINYRDMPDPGPRLLPRPGPLGGRGPGPLGDRGSRPARSAEDEINRRKAGPAPQGPHGRPHPRTAAGPARPWSAVDDRRTATPRTCCTPPARPRPGEPFTADGQTLTRSDRPASRPDQGLGRGPRHRQTPRPDPRGRPRVLGLGRSSRCCAPPASASRNCSSSATTAWCNTGCPTTGELVPLLQIAPSKTDAERLLVVSPELADVLAADHHPGPRHTGAVPLVAAYDWHERVWLATVAAAVPAPRRHREPTRSAPAPSATCSTRALADTGLRDAAGQPLRYTPHDFRRMFITDAIMNGLPPHIAQVIVGHRDINVTLGYKAVYPDEAIQAHRAFLARRRALRPSRGIPHPHRRGMGGVPRPLRTPQGLHRHLRPRLRHPLHPRTRLHPLPPALARPRPTPPPRRHPRQPDRPHRRSRTRRLARRSRRTQDQPRRRQRQARPDRPTHQHQPRRPRNAHLPDTPRTQLHDRQLSSENPLHPQLADLSTQPFQLLKIVFGQAVVPSRPARARFTQFPSVPLFTPRSRATARSTYRSPRRSGPLPRGTPVVLRPASWHLNPQW